MYVPELEVLSPLRALFGVQIINVHSHGNIIRLRIDAGTSDGNVRSGRSYQRCKTGSPNRHGLFDLHDRQLFRLVRKRAKGMTSIGMHLPTSSEIVGIKTVL